MRSVTWICALGGLALAACGSSSGGTGGAGGGTTTSTGTGAACSGTTPVALTVKNYESWCSITVDSSPASSAAEDTVCVPDGSVSVTATALSGFQLGDWHGTAGDTGSGDPGTVSGGTSTAMVTVSGSSACVWVCCPFTGGSGCPTTDQCP